MLLFLATAFTVSVAGAFWSEGLALESPGWRDLPRLAQQGWLYGAMALAILGAHELGHYFACRFYKVPATLPIFLPGVPPFGTFGAVIRIRAPIPHRRALFDIAVAGPIAGFVVALPVAISGLALGDKLPSGEIPQAMLGRPLLFHLIDRVVFGETLYQLPNVAYGAAWLGAMVTSLNLFPVGQLDGGHVIYAFSRRWHRWASWFTILALALWIGRSLWMRELPPYLLWLGMLLFLRDRHPRLLDEGASPGPFRIAIALAVLLIFGLCLIPTPFHV